MIDHHDEHDTSDVVTKRHAQMCDLSQLEPEGAHFDLKKRVPVPKDKGPRMESFRYSLLRSFYFTTSSWIVSPA